MVHRRKMWSLKCFLKKIYTSYLKVFVDPPYPRSRGFLGFMIIFCGFSDSSQVGWFQAAEGDWWGRLLGGRWDGGYGVACEGRWKRERKSHEKGREGIFWGTWEKNLPEKEITGKRAVAGEFEVSLLLTLIHIHLISFSFRFASHYSLVWVG